MAASNTAADRLFRIMKELASSRNGTLVDVWAKVLRLPSSDRLEVFRGILSTSALVDEVESVIKQRGDHGAKLYERPLTPVRHILAASLDNHGNSLNGLLTPEVVNDLEHCAAWFATVDHEVRVDGEQINQLKDRVEKLVREVKAADLPRELKFKLMELLEVMRQQISQFEIRGATALQECFRQSLVRLMEMHAEIEEHKHKSEPLLKRVVSVITDIGKICDAAQKALPLLKTVGKLVPLLLTDSDASSASEPIEAEVMTAEK